MDRRIPVEVQLLLVVLRLRLDAAPAQRVAVYSGNFAALRLSVNVVRIGRVFKHPEAIAPVNIFPARIADAAGIRGVAHPNAVVLQAAINVVGVRIVNAYVIELRGGQIPRPRPASSAVCAAPETSIVT